ncbi:MAG: helix-turn-helix domain-containing protein [Verrucomicrobiaceae bacterium]|jgi:transcriptional regulator with XRE-family HTH domain
MKFGEFMLQRRLELGLSIASVARSIGVTHTALYLVETGRRNSFRSKYWPRIAHVLKTDTDFISTLEGAQSLDYLRRKVVELELEISFLKKQLEEKCS